MLVTLPFVLLLLDYWPLYRFRFGPSDLVGKLPHRAMALRLIWEKTPLFVLVAMSSAITVYAQKHGGLVVSLDEIPFNIRVANALVAYAKYIGKMIYPAKLAALYPHPGMLPWWEIIGACFFLVSISFVAIKVVKRSPYFAVGWLWYIGTLVPVIGLVQVGNQSMADRYTYVPFIGLFIIIAWGVPELVTQWEHKKKGLAVLATVVLATLMPVTWKQASYWKNSITLFEHNLKVTADHCALQISMGDALEKLGRTEEAVKHYFQALQLKPDFQEAHNNLGNALLKQGKATEAIKHFKDALRLNPEFVEAYNSLGTALIHTDNIDEAIVNFKKALQIDPSFAETHVNLGGALIYKERIDEAIVHFRKALEINPDISEAHVNLGVALANTGKIEEAIDHFKNALQIEPDSPEALDNLSQALASLEKIDREIEHIQEQVAVSPEDPMLNYNLGNMYRMKGQWDKAQHYYTRAVSLEPEFPEALYELAKLHISQGKYEKAVSLYSKMIAFLPDNPIGYYNIACVYARQNKPEDTVLWLNKAVARGLDDWNHIKTDRDLDTIRNSDQYKAFIKGR